jgi:hypothetical protein
MKLWILKPTKEGDKKTTYDCHDGFVVRARTEEEARALADNTRGDEAPRVDNKGRRFWVSPELSTCEELGKRGEPGVVLGSFNAG